MMFIWLLELHLLQTVIALEESFNLDGQNSYVLRRNCDFHGNDIGAGQFQWTVNACASKCLRTPGCGHFTYNAVRICFVKRGTRDYESALETRLSDCGLIIRSEVKWPLADKVSYSMRSNCDFRGKDISDGQLKWTAKECALACIQKPGCGHFTYNLLNLCFLKRGFRDYANAEKDVASSCGVIWHEPSFSVDSRYSGSVRRSDWCIFHGNDLKTVDASCDWDCANECLEDSNCTHFDCHFASECHLKSGPNIAEENAEEFNDHSTVCGIVQKGRPCGMTRYTNRLLTKTQGPEARRHAWPWIAHLAMKDETAGFNSSSRDFCGGTLITPTKVLTAAHCVFRRREVRGILTVTVRLGVHSRNWTDEPQQKFIVKANSILIHPSFDEHTLTSDLAIITLNKPAEINDYVNLPCLGQIPLMENADCFSAGWGLTTTRTDDDDRRPRHRSMVLREAKLPLLDRTICHSFVQSRRLSLDSTMICAGGRRGNFNMCEFDSGGPLVCVNDDRWYLHGVLSWGFPCTDNAEGQPDMFASTDAMRSWILANV